MPTQESRPGATVIAFPGHPEARLALALAKLDAALRTQHAAVEGFRRSLVGLSAQVCVLERGLLRYRTRLGTLGSAVAGLHLQARTLAEGTPPRSSA